MIAYRFLTAVDDASFCHKVSEALSNGWVLYGDPTYAYDEKEQTMRCGQAVTKSVPEAEYSAELKLGAL